MSEFQRLRAAAEAGGKEAVERWYREYRPAMKRAARWKIKQLRLEMELEPDDILDSVFRVICLDPSRLDDMEPWQVYAYLEQMTNHKVADASRRRAAKKRGGGMSRKVESNEVPGRDASVSEDFALREEILSASAKLSSTERKICMYRVDKYSWEEIGELMELSPAAAQKRYERAVARVSREFQSP